MLFKAIAALTVAASALAQAAGQNVTITAPSPTWWWIEESENKLAWANGNPADSTTIYINHKDNNVLAGGTLAIKAITNVFDYSALITLPPGIKPNKGYYITIQDSIYQDQRIYGKSQEFEVKAKGSAYPDQNQDLSGKSTSASSSATGTASGSAEASGTKSGASSAPSPSKDSGAQQNMAATALAAGAAALAYVVVA